MKKVSDISISQDQQNYLRKHRYHHRLVGSFRIFILFCFFFLWEAGSRVGIIDSFFFSSPSGILSCLITQARENSLLYHIGTTLYETMVSFLIVFAVSFILSALLWYYPTLSEVMEPFTVILNSLPKSALAPLFIVWLGTGQRTIIIAGISVAIFGSIISFYTSFLQTDSEKLKLIDTLGGSRLTAFWIVVLPGSALQLISIAKVNIGLSLVGVIIGEFLAARRGLGYLIIYGSQVFRLDLVISSITVLCMIAFLLYRVLQSAEHKLKKRMGN